MQAIDGLEFCRDILSAVVSCASGVRMRELGGKVLFSASDLMRPMGCRHSTTLDLMRLRGDPRQLSQVVQGAHPDPATFPPDRGIFLPVSRRMHPEICRFISEQVYQGQLTSHPDTARQAATGTAYPRVGAFLAPVEREGKSQVAGESDIVVVAPYNAQVNALRAALSEGIRVGSAYKFQGREAPAGLVSMTVSSAEEIPRGLEFLYSTNRTNAAISRAKARALVFTSPGPRDVKYETVDQMRLVNLVCAFLQWRFER